MSGTLAGQRFSDNNTACVGQIHTSSQSSPMQAYNQAINDLDKELDHLKSAFEEETLKHSRDF